MNKLYFDKDIDMGAISLMKIGVIGYGNQGRAQALNLKDSGLNVTVGLRNDSKSIKRVDEDGLEWTDVSGCVRGCDVICMMIPDQSMSSVYEEYVSRYLKPGKVLLFSHGYNIHYQEIIPPHFVDVIMVAPSGPGHAVRQEFKKNSGIPTLVAVHQNVTGRAQEIALAYSKAIGGSRLCCFSSTFKEETETDLFGEQVILTGIIPRIINESFKVLLEAGYSPTIAWFVTFYEVRQIAELISNKGVDDFFQKVSDTAEYGGMSRSNRLIGDSFKKEMRQVLEEIQSGDFHKEWQAESNSNYKSLTKMREEHKQSPLHEITSKMLELLNNQKDD